MSSVHIGYVLKMFPRLSETFVMNELLELERQGHDLSVFSLFLPNDGRFHGRLAELGLTARYVPSVKPESYWEEIQSIPTEFGVPIDRWPAAVEFLRVHAVPKDLEFLLRAVVIASEVRQRGITHLHAHFATIATRMAATVSLLTGVPFSFTAHAKDIFRTSVNRSLFTDLVRRSAFCVTVSDFNRNFICEQMPDVSADKVVRLYNGIDLEVFERNGAGVARDRPHIVSVGRLVPKKGFDRLLHALALCRDRGFAFRATVAGGGEQLPYLIALRDELDLASAVEFRGALSHEAVGDLMRDADIMALPCVREDDGNMDALPTVLLEALALDLPIVSTRLTGIPEIVGDECGLLCEPGDDMAFADSLCRLWEQIRDGRRASGVGRRRAERHFDLSRNVATLAGMFTRTVAERVPA